MTSGEEDHVGASSKPIAFQLTHHVVCVPQRRRRIIFPSGFCWRHGARWRDGLEAYPGYNIGAGIYAVTTSSISGLATCYSVAAIFSGDVAVRRFEPFRPLKGGGSFKIDHPLDTDMFAIRTDKPNAEVSWHVTGIRQDGWAEVHRIPVEVEQDRADRGHYLHPELLDHAGEPGITELHG
jgi:hypothetical protein